MAVQKTDSKKTKEQIEIEKKAYLFNRSHAFLSSPLVDNQSDQSYMF